MIFGPDFDRECSKTETESNCELLWIWHTVLVKPQHFYLKPKRTKTGNCRYHVRHFCCNAVTICHSWILLNGESISYQETSWNGSWILIYSKGNVQDSVCSAETLQYMLMACWKPDYMWHQFNLVFLLFFKCFLKGKHICEHVAVIQLCVEALSCQRCPNFSNFPPVLILHLPWVCSLQMLGLRLHVWDARLLCSPGMNPSERSLEYSLLNLGEGHRIQPFPALLPNEQTYGHEAPWTCLGDQNYLAPAAAAKETGALKEL